VHQVPDLLDVVPRPCPGLGAGEEPAADEAVQPEPAGDRCRPQLHPRPVGRPAPRGAELVRQAQDRAARDPPGDDRGVRVAVLHLDGDVEEVARVPLKGLADPQARAGAHGAVGQELVVTSAEAKDRSGHSAGGVAAASPNITQR
jgi:hypothetical protein